MMNLRLGMLYTVLALFLLSPSVQAASANFEAGVQAYRQGDYRQAESIFTQLRQQQPDNARVTYYLAITEAQLGRFEQAKTLYQAVIQQDPNGETARLAQEGLQYLPPEHTLDLPPRFQKQENTPQAAMTPTGYPQGMSPQDMMAMQMLMQMGNPGGGNLGMNPMMFSMMQQGVGQGTIPGQGAVSGQGNLMGQGNIMGMDPEVFSTLMMNQMLQNFSLDGGRDDQ